MSACVDQPGEGVAAMDDTSADEEMWHEDDALHQAEGRLAVRLCITVDEAVKALRAHAEAEGTATHDVAARVVEGCVHIRL